MEHSCHQKLAESWASPVTCCAVLATFLGSSIWISWIHSAGSAAKKKLSWRLERWVLDQIPCGIIWHVMFMKLFIWKIHENLDYNFKREMQHLFIAQYTSTGSRSADLPNCCKICPCTSRGIFGSLAAHLWCDMAIFGDYIQLLLKGRYLELEEGRRRG